MQTAHISQIQKAIVEAIDFIKANSDADTSGIGDNLVSQMQLCDMLLQLEKERMFRNNAKKQFSKKQPSCTP